MTREPAKVTMPAVQGAGMGPQRFAFAPTARRVMAVSAPGHEAGIVPVSWLEARLRLDRRVRADHAGGKGPDKVFVSI